MSGLNSFCGCGRLVSNAITLNTPKGGAKFRLAIDGFKKDDTLFIDCVRFGDLGNTFNYLNKGACVGVAGRLAQSSYKNASGAEVKSISVIVSTIQLVGAGNNNNDNFTVPGEMKEQVVSNTGNNDYEPFDDMDIPF